MSEVYRNSTQYVYLDIYGDVADAPPTAVCTGPDEENTLTVQGPTTVGDAQRWTAVVGFQHTQTVGPLRVVWTFAISAVAASKTDYLDVVVPLADTSDIREELEVPAEITDAEIVRTERRVRRIIEEVTGQQFAPWTGTLIGTKSPSGDIRLPSRLLSLTTVGGQVSDLYYVLADGGWALAIIYPLKRDTIRAMDPRDTMTAPITAPFSTSRTTTYQKVDVTGIWGYERIPSDVYEAALILIEQKLCPDAVYVERYLKTMTAADFRFEFAPGAYVGTGNVVADHLLRPYMYITPAVI